MDGLCAGVGLIAALTLAALFWNVSPVLAAAALTLAGAMGAFLIFNFKPASIFMGDSGSLLIGFSLALLSLVYAEHYAVNRLSAVGVPVFVMLVPIFDTTLVTFIRILSGRKASKGGKDHTSHRLVLMGLSEKGAVLGLYGIGAVAGVAAVFTSRSDTFTSPTVMIPAALAVLLMGIYLAQLRIYPEREFSVLRDKAYTPILLEVTYKRQILLVLMDLCLIAFSYYLSYRLRFEGKEFVSFFKLFLRSLPAVIVCKTLVFFVIGVYRGIWRYMSTNDVYTYLKASTIATFLCVATAYFLLRGGDFPMGIFIIDWFLTTGFLLGTRGSFRLFRDTIRRKSLRGDPVLIYGAGRGGEILLKEIHNNRLLNLAPVGFIDDDELKVGKRLQGYPVMGPSRDLEKLLSKTGATGVIISFTARSPERVERVQRLCRQKGIGVRRFSVCLEDVCSR
jgi:UDP-GlcNAc:undecaprenyl-phosphate GlcNAc-1-phosphate transferase